MVNCQNNGSSRFLLLGLRVCIATTYEINRVSLTSIRAPIATDMYVLCIYGVVQCT